MENTVQQLISGIPVTEPKVQILHKEDEPLCLVLYIGGNTYFFHEKSISKMLLTNSQLSKDIL